MTNVEYNKKMFCVYDDPIFWIANYIHEGCNVSSYIKEFLFFSREDAFLADGTNLLAMTDMCSDLYKYVDNWFSNFYILQSNDDWKYHKSNLYTRLKLINNIDLKLVDRYKAQNEKNHPRESTEIRNAIVKMSNAVYYNSKYRVNDKYQCNKERWLMWRELLLYKNGEIDKMKGMKDFNKEFDKLVAFRRMTKNFDITLEDFALKQEEIDKIKKDFESIYLKNNLENKLPIMKKIKNTFKI